MVTNKLMVKPEKKHAGETIVPKNGRYIVAMLVGGPADRAREIRDTLADKRGILCQYHLDYEKDKAFDVAKIPDDVDLVIILRTQLGHSKEAKFLTAVSRYRRENGTPVPVIRTSHKFSVMDNALRQRFGIGKTERLPENVISTAYFKKPREEVKVEPEPATKIEFTPPPPPPVITSPSEDEIRAKFLTMDTLALFREVQLRLHSTGMGPVLISAQEITISTGHLAIKLPEIG